MWLFLPGGLLMPSIVPEGKGDPAFTNNGLWMLQVRARMESHLKSFIKDYMEEGTYSEIEATPQMDYNFRFYTTHEALAIAVAKAILDIDYAKFKPTAERTDAEGTLLYPDGKKYHSTLNSIWGSVCQLGKPGGHYGAYSSSNPNGYSNAEDYYKYYQRPPKGAQSKGRAWWEDDYEWDSSVGSSFFDGEDGVEDDGAFLIAEATIDLMQETDLSVGEWFPFLTLTEDLALKEYAEKAATLPRGDIEPIELDLIEHYFGEDWESKLNKPEDAEVQEDGDEPPFDLAMSSNVQFESVPQNKSQRRKKGNRRASSGNKTSRGVNFN